MTEMSSQPPSGRRFLSLSAITAGIVLAFFFLRWLGPVGEREGEEDEVIAAQSEVVKTPGGIVLKLSHEAVLNSGISALPVRASAGKSTLSLDDIVYFDGKSWVYLSLGADQFQRVPVEIVGAANPNVVTVLGLHRGESIVDTGASLILSEELKSQMVEEF